MKVAAPTLERKRFPLNEENRYKMPNFTDWEFWFTNSVCSELEGLVNLSPNFGKPYL